MLNRRHLLALPLAGSALGGTSAFAQPDFPGKPIRVVLPFASGSGSDNSVRYVTSKVGEAMGWTFVVDNKPGGNSFIGVHDFLRAPADGHTLLYSGGTTHGVNSALFRQLPYDPIKDMVPVVSVVFAPMVLLARPSLRVDSAAQLIELIRKEPAKYTAATGSTFQQLAVNLLRHEAGLDFRDVAYKGSAQSMMDLVGGHVDFTIVDGGAAMPMVRSGMLKALAVTSGRRVSALPSTPTMAEAGLPDIRLNGWAAFFAKAGTPGPVLEKLRQAFTPYLQSAEYEKYVAENAGFYESLSPEQMNQFIRSEIERAKSTFQRAGIKPQ
ncbi:Bug family tripartite tricarboxylate transporter substrate binding protein [Comamonas composti]|uniref:Bug family tripartite tricarboxylate transporter substrate binding protein n=1 Tax=Comamonas composti TaxID=408558 RepID=UPI000415332C|nr:tripartite tricarboxylate transporter substrate binding protein [Comamonas composti]